MADALLVKLRPSGPWRFGPLSGTPEETGVVGHSDMLYSAVTFAMARLGFANDWRESQWSGSAPAVRFSSLFPFAGRTLFAIPPHSVWPPDASPRVRWKAARLVPLTVIGDLLAGRGIREERWEVDFRSECLIAAGSQAPFRVASRRFAVLDRVAAGLAEGRETACLEFSPNAGLWAIAAFRDPEAWESWSRRIESAFLLLADSGIGGERGYGWGQADAPEFHAGEFPRLLLPDLPAGGNRYWLLSLFSPAAEDTVNWSSGSYSFTDRAGVGSLAAKMTAEGSVIECAAPPAGAAVNAAAEGMLHPRWRAGFAVAVPLPVLEEAAP
jgi:CRISPR/Cas system CSM-associated protein Csm4 (group 5 of RAMP superfamily)